jgi:hypothetical protein
MRIRAALFEVFWTFPLERLGVQPNRIGADLKTVTDFLLKDYA